MKKEQRSICHLCYQMLVFISLAIFAVPGAFSSDIGTGMELSEMVLVRSTIGRAVVRFGDGPLIMISVGDRLGKNQAEVKEISAGRVVLEEFFIGKDGRQNRAEIIIKDGERGGTRYLFRLDEEPPVGTRPLVIYPGEGK